MNTKFVLRVFSLFLALTALTLAALALLPAPVVVRLLTLWITRPPDPTPPSPVMTVPRGEMPTGPVGLQEWRQHRGEGYELVGSGFLLQLKDGTLVGLTTAHSVEVGNLNHPLERIAFALAGQPGYVAELDTLHGPPGTPRTGLDLSMDWILLQVNQPVAPSLVLTPDSRGAPQPGERVSLFSGLGDGAGGRRELMGTVQSVDSTGVWVLMDETFDAGRMSGSPLLSQHTGQVVGMAVAAMPRRNRLLIAFHPIGHLVELAEIAEEFPKIAEYQRR